MTSGASLSPDFQLSRLYNGASDTGVKLQRGLDENNHGSQTRFIIDNNHAWVVLFTKQNKKQNLDFQTPVNSNLVVSGRRIRESVWFKADFGDDARFGKP